MIIGTGCDIVENTLTRNLKWSSNICIQQRIFSPRELELLVVYQKNNNADSFLSGRFAVKEAVLKCLGTGMKDGIRLTDIEVLKIESGQPFLILNGEVKAIADRLHITSWHISISHTKDNSLAFVIAESQ